jgi:hypothetical protein
MWNLYIDLACCKETLRTLLEFELQYALRMAAIEKKSLKETLRYTEWEMFCGTGEGEQWKEEIGTPEKREALFRNRVVPYLEKHFDEARAEISGSHAGFLYELHTEYYSDSPELFLTLHFRNKFAPDSPFKHRRELVNGLLEIVEACMEQHPEVRQTQCASWLNNREDFTSLFPPEYLKNKTFCLPMEGSTGWWGSFIDCQGNFNTLRGAEFKRLGGFSMPNLHCRCSVEALHRHLTGQLQQL